MAGLNKLYGENSIAVIAFDLAVTMRLQIEDKQRDRQLARFIAEELGFVLTGGQSESQENAKSEIW